MNNNDDGFKENLEYMAPNEMPTSQILTPTEVIEASDDLRPYIQLINAKLKERECDSWLISIQCDLNVEALNHLVDEVEDAGWHVSLGGKTINIH
ncbi:hypothetical protein [Lacticaseibacillus paracasei]|uniref:hypothetical protein n=1 Tax=Lacticaseibacillus paracasei TaxID=1597 RepID=UPI000F0B2ED2|nr:hypothetical protein [Lacticaseibacillus paracasei]RNE25088.1 hypothetical protein FAM6161_02823 [Lacticaseibacillus paracasei]